MLAKLISFIKNFIIYFARSILTYVLFLVLFIDRSLEYYIANHQVMPNWVLFVFIACLLYGIYKLKDKIRKIARTNFKVIISILFVALFLYQLVTIYNYYFYTGWDALTVRQAAFVLIDHPEQLANFNSYFSYHVNQLFITSLLGTLLRIGTYLKLSNPYLLTLVVSILMIDLSGLFMTISVKELTKRNDLSLFSFVLFILLLGLSPWVSIPYTDTYSILFSTSIFFIYIKNFNPTKINILKWGVIVFLTLIGGSIKPQVFIVFISIFMFELLRVIESRIKIIELLAILGIIVISFFGTNALYDRWMERFDFKLWPDRAFTYTHYIMTGLNPVNYGVYLDTDASISYEAATIQEREAANIEVIKQRLNDYGVMGFVDFFDHKTLINFNDGTFAWNGEGGFIVEIFDDKSILSRFYKELFYPDGNYYDVYLVFEQFVWLFTLSLMFLGIMNKKKALNLLLLIIFIGGFLFIQLFEARARYLIGYLPFYILLATFGFQRLLDEDFKVNDKIKLWQKYK